MIVLPNAFELISPPEEEPVSLTIAKLHCVVFHNDDDTLFTGWIAAARYWAEILSGERMITQQWAFTFPCFPSRRERLMLPGGPVQSLDSIVYIDEAGVEQPYGTLSGSPETIEEYSLVRSTRQSYITLKVNQDWPTPAKVFNAVKVTVTLGHNDTAAEFLANPQVQLIRSGMLLLIGHLNENRENVIVGEQNPGAVEVPLGIQTFLRSPKVG